MSAPAPPLPSPAPAPAPTTNSPATTSPSPTPLPSLPILPSSIRPITRVFLYPTPNPPSTLSLLTTRLLAFGATRLPTRFSVTCDHLAARRPAGAAGGAAGAAGKELYVVTLGEDGGVSHLISPSVVTSSSAGLSAFLASSTAFTSRALTVMEGDAFRIHDVTLSLGTVRQHGRITPHVALEVSYAPCCQVTPEAFALLQEAVEAVVGGLDGARELVTSYKPSGGWPAFGEFGLGDVFTDKHRALVFVFALQLVRGNA